ncbi:MAG: Ig-like domain-containing protein [Spirochaetales bacterium]|nr:Ig-like domain-containing protein [Spirochaetales bacterium]
MKYRVFAAVALSILILAACRNPLLQVDDDTDTTNQTFNGRIFAEGLSPLDVAFWNGDNGFEIRFDSTESYDGSLAANIDWSSASDWNGVAFNILNGGSTNLSGFNALSFWARTEAPVTIDKVGLGASTGSNHEIFLSNVTIPTTWTKFILPLPNPSTLTNVSNVLYVVDGLGSANIFVDNVGYETIEGLTISSLAAPSETTLSVVAERTTRVVVPTVTMSDGTNTILISGGDAGISSYLSWSSNNPGVATVDSNGQITGVSAGTATITGSLGDQSVSITVNVSAPVTFTGRIFDDSLQNSFAARVLHNANGGGIEAPLDNSIQFGASGSSVRIDLTASPAATQWGGGYIENVVGVDASSFTTLKFSVNTSSLNSNVDYMELKLEDAMTTPGTHSVNLLGLTPTATNGDWNTYSITLSSITTVDFTQFKSIGFWHPRAGGSSGTFTPGVYYVDDIRFDTDSGSPGSGGDPGTGGSTNELVLYEDAPASLLSSPTFWNGNNGFTASNSASNPYAGTMSLNLDWSSVSDWNGAAYDVAASGTQDLSDYTALTFYARAAANTTIDRLGFGAGSSFETFLANVSLTTTWTQFILPIPNPSKLTAATNLFFAADGAGANIYLDDIQFENLSGISLTSFGAPADATRSIQVGSTSAINVGAANFTVASNSIQVTGGHSTAGLSSYLTWTSSNTSVATVDANGVITGVAAGTSTITGTHSGQSVTVNLTVTAPISFTGRIFDDSLQGGFSARMLHNANGGGVDATIDSTVQLGSTGSSIKIDLTADPAATQWGGGFVENASGVDASSFTTLKFAIDTSNLNSNVNYMELKLEDTNTSPGTHSVNLLDLTPTATDGNWETYTITLSGITTVDFSQFKSIGFWHPRVGGASGTFTPGVYYIDDIRFESGSTSTPALTIYEDAPASILAAPTIWNGDNGFTISNSASNPYAGTMALHVDWSSVSDWNGAAYTVAASGTQNLSNYTALTFYARAASATTIDKIGFEAGSVYEAFLANVNLTTSWTQFILPIPNPSLLTAATTLFFTADGAGADIYLDDIKFENLSGVSLTSLGTPANATRSVQAGNTSDINVGAANYTVSSNSIQVTGGHADSGLSAYLTWTSSNTGVATVDSNGEITAVSAGTSTITGTLGSQTVTVNLTVTAPVTFNGRLFDDSLQNSFTARMLHNANGGGVDATIDSTVQLGSTGSSIKIDLTADPAATQWGGGFIENASGVDASSFTTLKFAVNTSSLASSVDYMELKLDDANDTPGTHSVNLLGLTATSTSGDWSTYTITLSSVSTVDFSKFKAIGFWHPKAGGSSGTFTPGVYYIDDIRFE